MSASLRDLGWLMPAPSEFRARCKGLLDDPENFGRAAQALAQYRTNAAEALALTRALRKGMASELPLDPLDGFHLGILASNTFDLLHDWLPAAAARHGVALRLTTAPYDQLFQQALDPASSIHAARPDAVLLAVDHRWFSLHGAVFEDEDAVVTAAVSRLRAVVQALREHGGAPAIIQTVAVPPTASLFGSYDACVGGSLEGLIGALNRQLVELARETGSYLLDVATLSSRVGRDAWFDPVHWLSFKLPFNPAFNPLYADWLGRLLGAIRGKARKCLVLDLDNTLWGGVIGDDGIDGIVLGQGSARGEAHLAVQAMALTLHERGVMLAVASKNTESIARAPFRDHTEMLLGERHIAVFQANWQDKPSNLEAIAKALNIGVDALVFLDDNPAERHAVRTALPQVAVPELPDDPAWYPWVLASAGYFESVGFSHEDRVRAQSYLADAQRAEVLSQALDMDSYLRSLDMVVEASPFDAKGRMRIVQLINKTNQFNLTTRRYTEAEIAALEGASGIFTLQIRTRDRFSDMGMISVIICRPAHPSPAGHNETRAWEIDTWLMSCRVLGRRIEAAALAAIVSAAAEKGVSRLRAWYRPTAKNGMVRGHYDGLGFELVQESGDGARLYELVIDQFRPQTLPFDMHFASVDQSVSGDEVTA